MRDPYVWIDPWAERERFEWEWRQREDEHREEMSAVVRACADTTYQIRQHAERMLDPIIRAEAMQARPIVIRDAAGLDLTALNPLTPHKKGL